MYLIAPYWDTHDISSYSKSDSEPKFKSLDDNISKSSVLPISGNPFFFLLIFSILLSDILSNTLKINNK